MLSVPPLSDEDRERLTIIRNAIAAGTYQVKPHDVATRLLLSMLEFGDDLSILREISSTEHRLGNQQEGDGKV